MGNVSLGATKPSKPCAASRRWRFFLLEREREREKEECQWRRVFIRYPLIPSVVSTLMVSTPLAYWFVFVRALFGKRNTSHTTGMICWWIQSAALGQISVHIYRSPNRNQWRDSTALARANRTTGTFFSLSPSNERMRPPCKKSNCETRVKKK